MERTFVEDNLTLTNLTLTMGDAENFTILEIFHD